MKATLKFGGNKYGENMTHSSQRIRSCVQVEDLKVHNVKD